MTLLRRIENVHMANRRVIQSLSKRLKRRIWREVLAILLAFGHDMQTVDKCCGERKIRLHLFPEMNGLIIRLDTYRKDVCRIYGLNKDVERIL